MTLNAPTLFPGSQEVSVRYEEQNDTPVLANTEMVLWHLLGDDGENMIVRYDSTLTINSVNDWLGQSFTVGYSFFKADYQTCKVRLRGYRVGDPGTITVNLKAADGDGKPTGDVLATGTFDASTLTDDTGGETFNVQFSSSATVLNGVQYAYEIYTDSADVNNNLVLQTSAFDDYGTGTEYGTALTSTNAGGTWLRPSGRDLYFVACFSGDIFLVNIFGTLKQVVLLDT